MSTTTGPTIHKAVEIDRLNELQNQAEKSLGGWLDDVRERFGRELRHSLAYAYRSGVLDGFQQGALAAAENDGTEEAA